MLFRTQPWLSLLGTLPWLSLNYSIFIKKQPLCGATDAAVEYTCGYEKNFLYSLYFTDAAVSVRD